MEGVIKFYNRNTGEGLIYSCEIPNVLFSVADWEDPSAPHEEDRVEFVCTQRETLMRAIQIKVIQSARNKQREKEEKLPYCPTCQANVSIEFSHFENGRFGQTKGICSCCGAILWSRNWHI